MGKRRWAMFLDRGNQYLGVALVRIPEHGPFPPQITVANRTFEITRLGAGPYAIPSYTETRVAVADHQGERG
jgi:hypothetical protein